MKWHVQKIYKKSVILCCITLFFIAALSWYQADQYKKQITTTVQVLLSEVKRLRTHVGQIKKEQQAALRKRPALSEVAKSAWQNVQSTIENGVVQVLVHAEHINWLAPYQTPQTVGSAGSGFFITQSGHLLTNYHVINQARSVYIRIPSLGQERFKCTVLGVCPDRDIALLCVEPAERERIIAQLGRISPLVLGNSDMVCRTQEVMAVGFPLGRQSIQSTIGNISGWQRVGMQSFVQLTSPINPGNSGGPVFDRHGCVVGVSSAGVPNAQNIGYFIPITEVKNSLKDLFTKTILRKPILGANFSAYTKSMREYLKNPDGGGWYVNRVFKGTPLHKAGIQSGDVIYRINQYDIDQYGDVEVSWATDSKVSVFDLLNRYNSGDTINLLVYRAGTRHDISFEFNSDFLLPIRKLIYPFEKPQYEVIAGMVVAPINGNILASLLEKYPGCSPYLTMYALPENQYENVLIVTHVLPDSPVQNEKMMLLAPGTIITHINDQPVTTLEQFRAAFLSQKKNEKFITITTRSGTLIVLAREEIIEKERKLAVRHGFTVSSLFERFAK